MSRIAVFGGSFSPVHIGHVTVACGVLNKGLADEVWMVPCRRNPLKEEGKKMLDNSTRMNLLRKAVSYTNEKFFSGKEKIKVDDIELGMREPSYTIDTMRALSNLYPEHEFRIVVGADSYLNFHRWRAYEMLQNEFKPIVYPRPGFELKEPETTWEILADLPEVEASSSEIRATGGKPEWQPWRS